MRADGREAAESDDRWARVGARAPPCRDVPRAGAPREASPPARAGAHRGSDDHWRSLATRYRAPLVGSAQRPVPVRRRGPSRRAPPARPARRRRARRRRVRAAQPERPVRRPARQPLLRRTPESQPLGSPCRRPAPRRRCRWPMLPTGSSAATASTTGASTGETIASVGADASTTGSGVSGSAASGAAAFAGAAFLAAAFFGAAFLTGLGSSGCSSRLSPSRSARRVTMSAYASASDDDGPFAATPSTPHRSRTSAFVIPSSFASSWILIFLAATLSIQPFTVVFASQMPESLRISFVLVVDVTAATFSDRPHVVGCELDAPRPCERTPCDGRIETLRLDSTGATRTPTHPRTSAVAGAVDDDARRRFRDSHERGLWASLTAAETAANGFGVLGNTQSSSPFSLAGSSDSPPSSDSPASDRCPTPRQWCLTPPDVDVHIIDTGRDSSPASEV